MVALEILAKRSIIKSQIAKDKIPRGVSCNQMNERITEDIVREHFKSDNMFKNIKLEEQKSRNERIKELLKNASKKGTGKSGFPEFIITFPSSMNSVIIIECKSGSKNHERKKDETLNPEKYAVDGVLHYSKFLNKDFNVIAIAVSGQNKNKPKVSNFIIKKGEEEKEIDQKLLSIHDYLSLIENENNLENLKHENILLTATKLNDKLHDYSVPEQERATIVSGILIALQYKVFRKSYADYSEPSELVDGLLYAVEKILKKKKMGKKIPILMDEYNTIRKSSKLAKEKQVRNSETDQDETNTILRDLIYEIEHDIFPFTNYTDTGYDILGQFYSEFIRYANGDKKLGLVLTPQHITELFIDIADLHKDDILYDNCCGTAGFLIKGLKKLFSLAGNDSKKKEEIKSSQILGIEQRSDMFTFACSNMMMRGDGKSNIFPGDSLSTKNKTSIKKHKPTIGLLNPPYSTKIPELKFVYNNIECLQRGGTCVAIIPMRAVLDTLGKNYEWKKKLLEEHTLRAVFSMPVETFYPIGTVTAIIVLNAHNPHPDNYETYFGYWHDDGFEKKKPLGRIDKNRTWKSIKKEWLDNHNNKKVIDGHSIMKKISEDDEWCAEAYMKTDYSTISEKEFSDFINDYAMFNVVNSIEVKK